MFLKGTIWKDEICLHFSQCVHDFQYFAVEYQEGLREPVDGILGLARNKNVFIRDETASTNTTKSYVTGLKEEGLIDKEIFSFYFDGQESSYVDFGEIQTLNIKPGSEIKYVETNEDFFWSMDALGVGFARDGESIEDATLK